MSRRRGSLPGYAVMLFVAAVSLFPFLWLVLSSFKTNSQVLTSAFSLPERLSFVSYIDAVRLTKLHHYFANTLLIAVAATALAIVIFGMAGYVLARYRFPGNSALFVLFASSLLVPYNAMLQPIFILIHRLHLYDTKLALILVYTATSLPIALFLMRSFFTGLPRDLEEAAVTEGAGFLALFVKVMLPLSAPAMASTGVLVFLNCWNEFMYAVMLTSSQSNATLTISVKFLISRFTFDYPTLFAALVLTMLPSIAIYVLLQEQIMKSMIAGAVKG